MGENENFIQNKYGYCFYCVEPNEIAIIYNLYIEPKYRRKGHAKHLLQLIIEEIRKSGHNKAIQIEALPRENSIDVKSLVSFYEKTGLKVNGKI